MKKQIKKRFLSLAVCIAIISLSAFAVFANSTQQGDLGRDIIREGESVLPDTDNGNVGDGLLPAPDTDKGNVGDGLVPAPDTDPDTKPEAPESDKDTMDKDDAKPDDGHDVKKDGEGEKRFNYTGLIVALIIAVAAVILIIIMIPSSKRNGNASSGERKK